MDSKMSESAANVCYDSMAVSEWPNQSLEQLFLGHCERQPGKEAVRGKDGSLTYSDLDTRSKAWAGWLISRGLGAGDNILVCVDRTIELPAILLGILRAGACYVPVDPALPADRVAIIVEDSGSKAAVTDRANTHLIPEAFSDRTFLVESLPELTEYHALPSWNPDDLAYLLFTSGSTGRPKGVPIPRGAMVNFLLAMANEPGIEPSDRVLALTTVSFDISVLEIFLPLISGASIYLVSRNDGLDPALLSSIIDENQLTLMQATPATWRMLTDYGWRPNGAHRLISGGEAFPVGLAKVLCSSAGAVWNCYGPTEATVYASVHRVTLTDVENAQIPLGSALPNLVYRISDENGLPCRVGQPGELWIAGVGVTPGYYGRPELNQERFAEAEHDGQALRFYRTGDLVSMTDDGALLYIDRLDNQVKIRGFRVELGEIETVLSSLPGIGESAVVLAGPAGAEPALVGCIRGTESGDQKALESALAEKLPSYMIPKAWRWYPDLPVTPSRKIDRKALKAWIQSESPQQENSEERVEFADPSFENMARCWHELLGAWPENEQSDFFLLGGHSLIAASLSVMLLRKTGKHVRPVDLLTHSKLAEHVQLFEHAEQCVDRNPMYARIEDLPERIPFSSAQKRMWYAVLAAKSAGVFYESEAYQIDEEIDLELLKESIRSVLADHVAFRMVIADSDELEWVIVDPRQDVDVVTVDPEGGWDSLPDTMTERARRPFDFHAEPLVRFIVYTDHEKRHVIQYVAHHMIIDGLSQSAVWKEVARNYDKGTKEERTEADLGFAGYLNGKREIDQRSDLDYWVETLADAPGPLDIKTDYPRPPTQSFDGATVSVDLPEVVGEKLFTVARDLQVTPFAVALSLYALFLDKHAQQGAYVIGVPVSGRQPPITQDMVGLFINTIAVPVRVDQHLSFDKLARDVSASSLEAMQHDGIPFDEVVNAVCPDRDPSRMPIYQTMLGLNDYTGRPSGLSSGVGWEPLVVDTGFSQFDLLMFVETYSDRLRLVLQGNTSLYKRSTLQRFVERFGTMMEAALDSPDTSCEKIDSVTGIEKRLIDNWHLDQRAYHRDSSVFQCFAAQARSTPEASAIACGDLELSYRELEAYSARIAGKLIDCGVEQGARVGISSRRTVETVAGILGILRAGASYVPLDFNYPDERLATILQLTEVRHVLGDESDSPLLEQRKLSLQVITVAPFDASNLADMSHVDPRQVDPLDGAYVMFTSGSTGLPKGIEVCHRNILRLVLNNNFMPLDSDTRFLMYAPVAFDASTLEIWGPLLNGGTLVIPEKEQISMEELGDVLESGKVTALWLTAALFHYVAEYSPDIFKNVRHLLAGGDVLSPKWVAKVLEENPGLTLINGYGPTENTTFTCCYPMHSPDQVPTPIPVGFPISNTTAYILDAYGNDCPIGVPGNLFTGGDGVALGYVNDQERTDQVFVTNPCGRAIGRVYNTGDLASWREDGAIEFLGRVDNQVKIRGFRIEPDEISTLLEQYPGVEQAITVPWIAPSGEKQLVSYVTPEFKNASQRREIVSWLKQKLPRYMVPDYLIDLSVFPVGQTGKVNRRQLPEPQTQNNEEEEGRKTPPSTPTEKQLAEIWSRVLNQTVIAREDDFFRLGGTSIKALQVFTAIVRDMKRDIPLSTLLEYSSLVELARVLDDQLEQSGSGTRQKNVSKNRSWTSLVPMGGEGVVGPLVCVHAVGGNVLSYRTTLEKIGQNRPRVGFQSKGLDGYGEPKPTLREQADDYVAELLDAGYTGTFTLMGGSMGGTIALEMASILTDKGYDVDYVVLLDTIGPSGRDNESDEGADGGSEAIQSIAKRIVPSLKSRATYALKKLSIAIHRIMGKPVPYGLRPFFIEERNKRALTRHTERPYAGDVLLVRGTENFGGVYKDPKLGWEGVLTGKLEIREAPVAHEEFMESPEVIDILETFFSSST